MVSTEPTAPVAGGAGRRLTFHCPGFYRVPPRALCHAKLEAAHG